MRDDTNLAGARAYLEGSRSFFRLPLVSHSLPYSFLLFSTAFAAYALSQVLLRASTGFSSSCLLSNIPCHILGHAYHYIPKNCNSCVSLFPILTISHKFSLFPTNSHSFSLFLASFANFPPIARRSFTSLLAAVVCHMTVFCSQTTHRRNIFKTLVFSTVQ